jgi:hypothetical protein
VLAAIGRIASHVTVHVTAASYPGRLENIPAVVEATFPHQLFLSHAARSHSICCVMIHDDDQRLDIPDEKASFILV